MVDDRQVSQVHVLEERVGFFEEAGLGHPVRTGVHVGRQVDVLFQVVGGEGSPLPGLGVPLALASVPPPAKLFVDFDMARESYVGRVPPRQPIPQAQAASALKGPLERGAPLVALCRRRRVSMLLVGAC